jgi:hypothetical protein
MNAQALLSDLRRLAVAEADEVRQWRDRPPYWRGVSDSLAMEIEAIRRERDIRTVVDTDGVRFLTVAGEPVAMLGAVGDPEVTARDARRQLEAAAAWHRISATAFRAEAAGRSIDAVIVERPDSQHADRLLLALGRGPLLRVSAASDTARIRIDIGGPERASRLPAARIASIVEARRIRYLEVCGDDQRGAMWIGVWCADRQTAAITCDDGLVFEAAGARVASAADDAWDPNSGDLISPGPGHPPWGSAQEAGW